MALGEKQSLTLLNMEKPKESRDRDYRIREPEFYATLKMGVDCILLGKY
jgi:hypothetical protein